MTDRIKYNFQTKKKLAEFFTYGRGCFLSVSGDQFDSDPTVEQCGDRFSDSRPRGVTYSHDSEENQILQGISFGHSHHWKKKSIEGLKVH